MNKQQLKIKILVVQCLDWLLIIGLLGGIYYAVENDTNKFLIAVCALIGLAIIHQIGLWSVHRIHTYRINIKHIEHDEKQHEIQELMSKGGQKVKKS